MARLDGSEGQDPVMMVPNEALPLPPRIIGNSRPEEGEAKGEGWAAFRSLAVVIGVMVLLSYMIFAG